MTEEQDANLQLENGGTPPAACPDSSAKIDGRKTEAFREAARLRAVAQWTAAARASQSELIKQKMKAPAVRTRISDGVRASLSDPDSHRRHVARMIETRSRPEVIQAISDGTRAGMARWRGRQLDTLRQAWVAATCKQVRREFFAEISVAMTKGLGR